MFTRTLFIQIALILSGVFSASAQERAYHGEALFGMTGPVKEFTMESNNPFNVLPPHVTFTSDGQVETIPLDYDEAGYPTGCDMKLDGKTVMKIDAKYDAGHLLKEMYLQMNTLAPMKMEATNEYDSNGGLIQSRCRISIEGLPNMDGQQEAIVKYSDVVYDSYGNWTSRKLHFSAEGEESDSFSETRTISYY